MIVGAKYKYIFTMYDNGRGNTSSVPIGIRYCASFPELHRTIKYGFSNQSTVPIDSATALWCALVLNTTKCIPMSEISNKPTAHRYLYVDNFYTRHVFADKLLELTNGEIFTTGTVRYMFVGPEDKVYVDKALKLLNPNNVPRGSWYLVAVHDLTNPKSKAKNCGYIIYKDNKLVIFYTNNLAGTPCRYILSGDNSQAIECVNGLGEILRYDKVIHTINKNVYHVPNIIVAYNKYMNSVDVVDQTRKTSYTPRKERKIYMSFFHLILDYAINNAYALYKWVLDNNGSSGIPKFVDLSSFKTEIGIQLCKSNSKPEKISPIPVKIIPHYGLNRDRGSTSSTLTTVPRTLSTGIIDRYRQQFGTMHLLRQFKIPEGSKQRIRRDCFLHSKLQTNGRRGTMYACTYCKVPFCPECFSLFHQIAEFDSVIKFLVKKHETDSLPLIDD